MYKVFQDPTARHAIITLRSNESLYLSRNSKKPKPIPKLKVGSRYLLSTKINHYYFKLLDRHCGDEKGADSRDGGKKLLKCI